MELIHERGFRKGYVADQTGIPLSSLSRLLHGTRDFSPHYALKLSRFFGVPIETFLDEEAK